MKIAWVADNKFEEIPTGGAEATNRALVNSCPYPVTELTPSTLEKKEQLTENDLVIFGNIKWFTDEQMEWMLDCPVRMKYEHDYWNLANPGQERFKKPFWEGCVLCIFHSPAHVLAYEELYPDIKFNDIWLQPSSMDVDLMHPGEKEDVTVYIGSLTPHKGVMDALAWGEENDTDIYVYGVGECLEAVLVHPNAIYCGSVNYAELLEVYARAKRFIFIPNWIDPFARTVVESRLCGCEQILNNRIGVTSYPWWHESDDVLREVLKERANSFWNILEML